METQTVWNMIASILTGMSILVAIGIAVWQERKKRKSQNPSSKINTQNVSATRELQIGETNIIANNIQGSNIAGRDIHNYHYPVPTMPAQQSRPTPTEIVAEVRNLKPALRNDARQNYIGLSVNWHVTIYSIDLTKDDDCRLSMYPMPPSAPPVITACIDLKKNPGVRVADANQPAWVSGKIASVDDISITLSDVSIRLENVGE